MAFSPDCPEELDQVGLTAHGCVSVMSGGVGALKGIVFFLHQSVWTAVLAAYVCTTGNIHPALPLAGPLNMEPQQPHICGAGTRGGPLHPQVHQIWHPLTT